jgi:formimidoylglutamate deiminase
VPLRAYLPDLLVADGRVRAGAALVVSETGAVASVGPPPPGAELHQLPGAAILPAFASAHGHSFQRALRGRTEWRADGSGVRSTFWTWREAMYAVAARLSPDDLHAVARLAFHELARAGVAVAGEFHYVQHDPAGRPYADPDALAVAVVEAAREVGIRIVLLRAAYARSGAGRADDPAQRRFVEGDPAAAVAALERLMSRFRGAAGVSFGLAPHSVRACPAEWIRDLAGEAARRELPLHLHVSEQPREVQECVAEHGVPPVLLLERLGALGPRTTAVHAIHLSDAEVRALGGAHVCACPTTERNLGDGVVPADRLLAAGARLSLGVDSHAQADLLEEARELELHLRLVTGQRAVLQAAPAEQVPSGRGAVGARIDAVAWTLLTAATAGGYASLGLRGGRLAPGEPADFLAVELDHPAVAGATAEDLLPALVFGASSGAITSLWVGGAPVVQAGQAAARRAPEAAILRDYRAALARLRA